MVTISVEPNMVDLVSRQGLNSYEYSLNTHAFFYLHCRVNYLPKHHLHKVNSVSELRVGCQLEARAQDMPQPWAPTLRKNFTQTFVFGSGEVTTISGKAANISVIPIKLGARYTANGSTGFFGEVGAGGAFVTQGGGVSFDYSPGIGYAFNPSVEAGVRYEGW
eukprot:gene7064-7128_t